MPPRLSRSVRPYVRRAAATRRGTAGTVGRFAAEPLGKIADTLACVFAVPFVACRSIFLNAPRINMLEQGARTTNESRDIPFHGLRATI